MSQETNRVEDVVIATDGACSGNPGPGGWGAILLCKGKQREISGRSLDTTNNQMELTAVLEGLKRLRWACHVVIVTDSAYVANTGNGGWLKKWKDNGWRTTGSNKPVANRDLWEQIATLISEQKSVVFEKVTGHSGHYLNERADKLATDQRDIAKAEKEVSAA